MINWQAASVFGMQAAHSDLCTANLRTEYICARSTGPALLYGSRVWYQGSSYHHKDPQCRVLRYMVPAVLSHAV